MLFSRKPTNTRRAASKKKFRRLLVEQMEQRCMFVVGAFSIPAPVNPGAGFDGVVELNSDLGSCTGSLLGGGQHILTAAHCVTDGSGNINVSDLDVTFEMPTRDIVFNVDISKIDVHPSWTGATTSVGDLAVLTLDALAPVRAERYRLYGDQAGDAESIGQTFTLVGYGVTGTGATGQQAGTGGTKRLAFNQIGVLGPAASQLRADFDDGVTDTLGDGFGLGASEGDQASGDSGGPSMLIGNAVAGIASYSTDFNGSGNNSDFGDWFTATRVSSFLGYIQGIRDAAGPLVIDMNLQEQGNNGSADRITMRRQGSDIVVSFSGLGEVLRRPFGLTTEIQVIGSPDADTLFINEDNGRVIPAGGVKFDGGAGAAIDSLEYKGDTFKNVNYFPDDAKFGDGTIEVVGFGNIDFENLEPVTISAAFSLTIITPNSQDDLLLDSPAAGQNRLSGTSGGVPFEPISFFDVSNVAVDMGSFDVPGPGTDRFIQAAPFAASLLNNFRVLSGPGNDFISVIGHPVVSVDVRGDAPQNGDPGVPPGDTLAVDATGFSLVNAPINQPNGTVNAVGMAPIVYTSIESLVVSDRFESNDTLATATVLGSEPEVTLRDLSIHDAADEDWFQITANQTGKLAINVFFKDVVGDLDVQVRDSSGDVITGSFSLDDNEQIVIPVVSQEIYYILVYGFGDAVNNYSLEIENFALPVPILTDLVRSSDTGESWSDNVTRDNTPTLDVLIDLVTFTADVTSGRTFLTAAQAAVPTTGFGVVIAITDAATGVVVDTLSDPLGINSSLWRQTTAALPDGTYLIAAAAYVIDGQNPKASGNGAFGAPLVLTIDTVDPTGDPVDLATESDSGFLDTDNVTSIRTPTFEGFAEPGTILRLLAGTRFIGMTVVGSDESDGIIGNNRGRFSVQSTALDDGLYNIRYTLEDLAGHVSLSSTFLPVQIDSVAPNTPYLDIPANFDTGISNEDNVTRINTLYLSATTHNAGPVPPQIFANNLIYRVYVRPDSGNEVLLYDSSVAVGGPTALTQIFTTANLLAGATTLGALPDGVHNFKLEVEDRAGNISEDFLLSFKIDTVVPVAGVLDLASESDSGFSDTDNVTSIQTPNFTGVAEAGLLLRLFAGTRLVGTTTVGSDESDGVLGNGLGRYSVTSAALDDGVYAMTYTLEDLSGNISPPSAPLTVQIDTVAPNTPYLDIPSNFDTGRNDEDNVTRINTLLLSLTTHNAGPVPPQIFANNLIYRVFVRPEVGNEVLVFDSSVAVGAPTALTQVFTTADLLTGTTTLPALPNGAHNFKLEVEDRAGNISMDFLLPFVIDTIAPPAPTLRLDPAVTDTGVGFNPGTLVDNITRASTPGFYGRAEANSIVRLAADTASNNVINASDVAIGLAQTIPLDGNDAFPQGQYRLTSVRDLNNPSDAFPRDGLRQIGATAEDLAGNISVATFLDIAIDTTPPQVTAVDFLNGQSVFAPKPIAGVTPRVDSIEVTFQDSRPAGLPAIFDIDGVDLTQAAIPGNYIVRGDHTGRALIDSVTVVSSAAGVVTVRLNFASPLQDDRYTLQISEDVSDPTGNLLDGDSRSSEPGLATALLPSGNQIPGGNFAGRFTVDSRPEVGTVAQGIAYIDINGNNLWDPQGETHDATNRDFVLQMGTLTDAHFAGNFAKVGAAAASGFDKLGVYGIFGATYSFAFDTNDDGVADVASVMPAEYQVNGIPVAGNFNAAHPGDEIGLFDGSFWYLDLNGNNQINVGERIASNFNGLPIVGDFNGDGSDDLATYNNDTNTFFFDTNRNGLVDFQLNVRDALGRWGGLGGFTDRPVAGDLNLDGVDDLGLWVKGRGGQPPLATGEFFFWLSDRISPNPAMNFDSYSPSPLGNDLFTQFGNDSALPIFGNFDPPVQENPANTASGNLLHRSSNPMDANGDNFVSPLDVLVVINVLNSGAPVPTSDQVRAFATVGGNTVDVDNDRQVSPLDALMVINFINSRGTGGEGEGTRVAISDKPSTNKVDEFFSLYDEDEEWLPNRRRRS
jgi:hypothetical protein